MVTQLLLRWFRGPSWMTTALPFNNFFRWTTEGWPVLAWLLLLVLCLVYPIGIALHLADVWHPRQGALSVAMLTLVAATILALMFAWPVKQQLGWWPLLLYGVIEAPFKYYIMLLDSRWWSELSLDADISIDALDSNLSTPLLCEISSCLQETRVEPFQRPPHIHWTRVVLGRPFAAGAEGTVYDAELDGSSRIAVKVMYCDELDMHNVGKICREIEISWSLAVGCAQIVRLHGFTIQPPRAMVVMQLCGKGTLLELLQDVSLPYVTRLGLGEDIASAVTHMHSLGYLHRDIKSLNCFVTDEMEARLGDFGETITATEADALPEPVVTGTAEWMAPEILCHLYPESNAIQRYAGLGYTAGSDCFSLGVVLWECVTSKVPYDSLHNIERLSQDALLQRILSGLRVDEGEQIGDGQGGIVHEPLGDLLRAAWGDTPELRPDAAALSEGLRNEINRVLETKRDASQCLDAIGRGSPGSHPNGWMHMLLDDLDSGIQLVET